MHLVTPAENRRWVSTATPEATKAIKAALAALVRADLEVEAKRRVRDQVLRDQYANGVDVRDLAKIARTHGWPRVTEPYISRIVSGARTTESA